MWFIDDKILNWHDPNWGIKFMSIPSTPTFSVTKTSLISSVLFLFFSLAVNPNVAMYVGIKSHLNVVRITAAHIDVNTPQLEVKTVSESYYYQYKEVTAAQVEVSAAQELQRKMLSVQDYKPTKSEGFEQIVYFLSAHTIRVDGKEIIITESSVRRDLRLADEDGVDWKPKRKNTQVPQHVADEAVYKERGDRLVRAATTTSSLEVEQDSDSIDKTQSKATPNEASSPGTTSGGGLRCQEAMKDTIAQTRFENVSKQSNDLMLTREKTKTTQALEITGLKRRVKKLEKKQRLRTYKLKRLYKVGLIARVDSSKDEKSLGEDASKHMRISDINADEEITIVNDQDDAKMFDVNDLHGEEVFVDKDDADKEVSAIGELNAASIATTVSTVAKITSEEITLAQALVEIKKTKPKANGIILQEPSKSTATTTKTVSSKKSQGKEEQQELTDEENATLFMQLLEKRRKFFVSKRAEEKRNKPPTQAQQRKIMCTYLKNMEGKRLKDLKNKSFESIQKMFDRALNSINIFVDFKTEWVEGELKQLMKIILDEEDVAIDAIPLAIKPLGIVD
uniref:Uncharacterized protein n=1 Tax=Tanacetum cinerariifolium TaxID=118510 RepID=A0A699GSH0_TANCI|nr:hypothetical protein [Tanacetum cinerariifolium]